MKLQKLLALVILQQDNMETNIKNKALQLQRINFVIVSFFIILFIIDYFKIDYTIIGVFRELLTIPFLLAQVVFTLISIRFMVKNKTTFLLKFSAILLFGLTLFTILSFF